MPEDERQIERERVFVGTGLFWGLFLILLLVAGVIVFAAQNPDPVPVEWLTFDFRVPLVVIVLGTALVTLLLDELIGVLWRRRRRRILGERQELKRLRAQERAEPREEVTEEERHDAVEVPDEDRPPPDEDEPQS